MNESLILPTDHSSLVVLLLLAYAGIAIDLLIKAQEWIKTDVKPKVSLIVVSVIISILISSVLVYLREDIKEIFVVTKLGAVLLGYGNQTIFRKLVGTKTEKINSQEDINEQEEETNESK